jgi:HAE1 family hydrophobic/amphiphilic exporter-1
MFYLLILFTGIVSFVQLPVEFLPDLGYPKLTVITSYENASSQEVEEMISTPIEEVVSTLKDVRKVTSISRDEISLVTLNYNWGTDMKHASLQLREKLDNLRFRLPEEAERPNIARLDPSESPIMYLSLSSKETNDISRIQNTAENYIKKRLLQLSGVAAADIIGDLEEEIQIQLDKSKVNSFGFSVDEIAAKINSANVRIPGGSIREGFYKFNIRISGEFTTVEEIENTPIYFAQDGTVVFLRDIALVTRDFKDEKSIARLNRQRSLGILIRKEAGANTVKVCEIVRETLNEFEADYPDLQFHISVDHSQFIKESISGVLEAILIGGLLAFLVLFLFLSDVKSPLHIAIVIPIAVFATFIMMFFGNISLNIISLSGIALGIGMLVDNSIVVSENIFRHREDGKNWLQAAFDGTKEVGMAITASTLTTLAVFLPILYVKGIAASLFRQQALTVTFSLLASLLVSITLLPMLASLRERLTISSKKQKKTLKKPHRKWLLPLYWLLIILLLPFKIIFYIFKIVWKIISKVVRLFIQLLHYFLSKIYRAFQNIFIRFRDFYLIILNKSLKNVVPTLLIFLLFFVMSLFILWRQNKEFFPHFEQPTFTLLLNLESGTALNSTDEVVREIEKMIENDGRVRNFFTSVGRSTEDKLSYYLEESKTEHLAEIKVTIDQRYETEDVIHSLREKVKKLPVKYNFNRGDNELLSFLDLGETGLTVRIYGSDYPEMEKIAEKIHEKILANDTFFDILANHENQSPSMRLKIKRDALNLYNVDVNTISNALKTYVSGNKISDFYLFSDKIDITLKSEDILDLDALLKMNIVANGNLYPISAFVDAEEQQIPQEIEHSNQFRVISISVKFNGTIKNAVAQLENIISENQDKNNVFIKIEGLNEQIDESLHSLIIALIFAILLVYMILASQFESFLLPFIIMFTVPMGLIGVSIALYITDTSLNVMSTLGMIILSGIIVNDAILLVDRINRLHRQGSSLYDSIMDAAKTRFRPILMTTLTTVFGLLPLALALGSGAELQSAMAVSVIGGMLSATFLTLLFIPLIYSVLIKDKNSYRGKL